MDEGLERIALYSTRGRCMNKTEYQLGNRSHQYCTNIYGNAQCSIDLVHLKTNLQLPASKREREQEEKEEPCL